MLAVGSYYIYHRLSLKKLSTERFFLQMNLFLKNAVSEILNKFI